MSRRVTRMLFALMIVIGVLIAIPPWLKFTWNDDVEQTPKPAYVRRVEEPKPGETCLFKVGPGLEMTFRWIPKGKATLGSPRTELDRDEEEAEFEFSTNGFWLGQYEVTQAEWVSVMGEAPSFFDGKKHNPAMGMKTSRFPVENVSWEECQTFLEKLNALPGVVDAFGGSVYFKLPHEKEWEYACRGGRGNMLPFHFGKELNGKEANCFGSSPYGTNEAGFYLRRTAEVGSYARFKSHPFGLCDMHGNVAEWCDNLYNPGDTPRVCRGGSWNDDAKHCRAASRDFNSPKERSGRVGFRVMGSAEPPNE